MLVNQSLELIGGFIVLLFLLPFLMAGLEDTPDERPGGEHPATMARQQAAPAHPVNPPTPKMRSS
jgi:hypothetical protein